MGWLERNRLAEHLHLVRDDPRCAFTERRMAAAARRRLAEAGQVVLEASKAEGWWRQPVGRPVSPRRGGRNERGATPHGVAPIPVFEEKTRQYQDPRCSGHAKFAWSLIARD